MSISYGQRAPICSRSVLQLLAKCYTIPSYRCLHSSRPRLAPTSIKSSQDAHNVEKVAVLGGGITGLATAFWLARAYPSTPIVLVEASDRLGGWLRSTNVRVGDGEVVFEQGPRSLRPSTLNGDLTLRLIESLGLGPEILATGKDSPAAQNRYIYFPDHLVRMPGPGVSVLKNLSTFWNEPLFDGLKRPLFIESLRPPKPAGLTDESVGDFISRRFSKGVADNVVSALFHGIYAGDIYKLSARSILPALWFYEQSRGSITDGMLNAGFGKLRAASTADVEHLQMDVKRADTHEDDHVKLAKRSSVYTLKGGLETLAVALTSWLGKRRNVEIMTGTRTTSITLQRESGQSKQLLLGIQKAGGSCDRSTLQCSHVISTLPSTSLAQCLENNQISALLRQTPSVTVMVVNLFYANPSLLPVKGFGYLLPRSLPFEQNPELALGVIFDSDATLGQDQIAGTKLTVMLGGHWWDQWHEYPDEQQGAAMAKSVLLRHLGTHDEPVAVRVSLQKDCIPQYTIGHTDRMAKLHHLLATGFEGRLKVAGNSYAGVGLNDCVRSASDSVVDLCRGLNKTGLDSFAAGSTWDWWPERATRRL